MPEDRSRFLLELLIKVNREVATALDLRTVLQRLLYAAIQYVGGERGSIVVMDEHGKPLDATIIYGQQLHEQTTQQLRETVEKGLAGWVMRHRKAALVPDTSKDERWVKRDDDSVEKSGAKSAICVPLMAREQMVGVLTLVHSIPNEFTQEHLNLMQAIADQASVAVLNARLYTESQRTARVMSALAEGAASINTSLELTDVWRRILNQTMQALQVETVALALIDPTSNDLVFQAAAGHNSGNIPGKHIVNGKGLAGTVVTTGRGVVIPAAGEDERYRDVDKFGGIETRAIAIVPIQSQGKVIGALEAINPISGAFDMDALLVMTGLGSLAGTTIQNARFLEQLKKAHQRYRELFEDSVDPILITDWEGKVLETNRQMIALSGYSNDQLRSMSIDQLHEVKWNNTGLNFETLKQGDECSYESVLHKQDSGTVPVEVHAHRVEFEESNSVQWILRDITERRELDALRKDMTSMVYHDIRSPLGNIISSLEMMGNGLPEDETLITMLNVAKGSANRIQRLVASLLDVNRLEAGHQIVEQHAVDPLALIREAIRDTERAAAGREQLIENKITTVLPLIWVDVDMIHRVFINLIENAIKYTPAGGHIEVGAQPTEDLFVKFRVSDNGPGISAADRERVFDKFTRLRGKNSPGGIGIGLSFCKLAVQGHGGQVWVESELGKGTTFWLTLPVAQKKQTGELKRQTGRLMMKEHKKS
ncbi:MAG: GAF domain-containing protein [Chloroflexi bacterium]|nr:GAF domain-containing protein [Chloroflexota bacterium]